LETWPGPGFQVLGSLIFFLNPHCYHANTAGTSTDGGAVIRKPGSAWLEGSLEMDLGHMNVVLKWTYLLVGSVFRH